MLYTVMNLDTVLLPPENVKRTAAIMSSNPYDYIRAGYYLDNASLFGGENNVDYNCNFKRLASGNRLDIAD